MQGKAQVHPTLSTFLDFHFLSIFSQREALHSCILSPLYKCRRTGQPPPPPPSCFFLWRGRGGLHAEGKRVVQPPYPPTISASHAHYFGFSNNLDHTSWVWQPKGFRSRKISIEIWPSWNRGRYVECRLSQVECKKRSWRFWLTYFGKLHPPVSFFYELMSSPLRTVLFCTPCIWRLIWFGIFGVEIAEILVGKTHRSLIGRQGLKIIRWQISSSISLK